MTPHQADPKNPVYLALGTNLGDRVANLRAALRQMPPDVTVISQSPVYQTAPWGFADQPDFLNQVIYAETRLSPRRLLQYLKEIETRLGRTPTFRYGPRLIDLDILFYGDLILDQPDLQIPHPKLQERAFVVLPLYDLNPGFKHPVSSLTVSQMLAQLDLAGVVRFRD